MSARGSFWSEFGTAEFVVDNAETIKRLLREATELQTDADREAWLQGLTVEEQRIFEDALRAAVAHFLDSCEVLRSFFAEMLLAEVE